jgi:hypothetical protein
MKQLLETIVCPRQVTAFCKRFLYALKRFAASRLVTVRRDNNDFRRQGRQRFRASRRSAKAPAQ